MRVSTAPRCEACWQVIDTGRAKASRVAELMNMAYPAWFTAQRLADLSGSKLDAVRMFLWRQKRAGTIESRLVHRSNGAHEYRWRPDYEWV